MIDETRLKELMTLYSYGGQDTTHTGMHNEWQVLLQGLEWLRTGIIHGIITSEEHGELIDRVVFAYGRFIGSSDTRYEQFKNALTLLICDQEASYE